jgi:Spy/CpxP family protein refolding chaperone
VKKWILAVAVAVAASAVSAPGAMAQGGGGQGRGGARMMEMLMQGITLTEAQKQQVDSITTKYRAELPAMTPGTPPSDADRQKMMDLRQKQNADIRAVLTDEQKKTFDKNIEDMRSRRPGAR